MKGLQNQVLGLLVRKILSTASSAGGPNQASTGSLLG